MQAEENGWTDGQAKNTAYSIRLIYFSVIEPSFLFTMSYRTHKYEN